MFYFFYFCSTSRLNVILFLVLLYICGKISVVIMRIILISIFLSIFVCFQSEIYAQDLKVKTVSAEGERVGFDLTVVGNKIILENAPVGKKIEIYSVVGLKVNEIEIKSSSSEYILNIPKGYYILKIDDTVRKIAIR